MAPKAVELKRPGAGRSRLPRPGLDRETFEGLLAALDADRERAAERYESIRRKLVRFFEWRGCAAPDELADEAIDRVGRRLSEGEQIRASDPAGYFLGVARNVLREHWEREQRDTRTAVDAARAGPGPPPQADVHLDCLERCLAQLPPESRRLVLEYYDGERGHIRERKALASRLGVGMNTLRIRVHRLRERLEACVRRCAGAGGETESRGRPSTVEGEEP